MICDTEKQIFISWNIFDINSTLKGKNHPLFLGTNGAFKCFLKGISVQRSPSYMNHMCIDLFTRRSFLYLCTLFSFNYF